MNQEHFKGSHVDSLVSNPNNGAFAGMVDLINKQLLNAFSALHGQPEQVQYTHSPHGFAFIQGARKPP